MECSFEPGDKTCMEGITIDQYMQQSVIIIKQRITTYNAYASPSDGGTWV